ncbi:hypothetical protein BD309DRAFT_821711, partial [Dichomitus squalens]
KTTSGGHDLENKKCECTECAEIRRSTGCENPNECMGKASQFLATLPPRWDPRGVHPEDYENGEDEEDPPEENAKWFERKVTTNGHLGNAFRIF